MRAPGVVLLCAVSLSLLGRLGARASAEPLSAPPPSCQRVFRCDTGGAGFGDELEHFAYCTVVAELLNATLLLPPGSFETGSKRHCCAAEYSDVAALLGVGAGRQVPAAAPAEDSAAELRAVAILSTLHRKGRYGCRCTHAAQHRSSVGCC